MVLHVLLYIGAFSLLCHEYIINFDILNRSSCILVPAAVSLLEAMLMLDPDTRPTATQGLAHPFLAEYHDPESEPDSQPYDDSFESLELAVGEWKSKSDFFFLTLP